MEYSTYIDQMILETKIDLDKELLSCSVLNCYHDLCSGSNCLLLDVSYVHHQYIWFGVIFLLSVRQLLIWYAKWSKFLINGDLLHFVPFYHHCCKHKKLKLIFRKQKSNKE